MREVVAVSLVAVCLVAVSEFFVLWEKLVFENSSYYERSCSSYYERSWYYERNSSYYERSWSEFFVLWEKLVVCLYVCIFVCVYVCLCGFTHACMYACMYEVQLSDCDTHNGVCRYLRLHTCNRDGVRIPHFDAAFVDGKHAENNDTHYCSSSAWSDCFLRIFQGVLSHMWIGRVTRMNEWVVSRMWMCPFTHVYVYGSRQKYEWVKSHMWISMSARSASYVWYVYRYIHVSYNIQIHMFICACR